VVYHEENNEEEPPLSSYQAREYGAIGKMRTVVVLSVWLIGLPLAMGQAAAPHQEDPLCPDRYHVESKFLTNPDENILIPEVITWCRNNQYRLHWDERYAKVARLWSGFLIESGEPNDRFVVQTRLRFELLKQGVTDQAILPYSAMGPAYRVPEGLPDFLDQQVKQGRYTHFAVGVTRTKNQKNMVTTLILGRRPALIDPLAVCPAPGDRMPVRLRLLRGYSHPRWLMTSPKGDVTAATLLYEEGAWRSEIPLDGGPGEYRVEIVVNGPLGPEVAALFDLFAGRPRSLLPKVKVRPEPKRYKSPKDAELALLSMINTSRSKQGLPALALDEKLSVLARKHAMQLLVDRHATHRTIRSGSLVHRLRKAKLAFDRALENVCLSTSPSSAHERFMDSPGHRRNVLDPNVNRVGLGVAMERNANEDILAVCQVFIENPQANPNAQSVEKVLKIINEKRRKRGRFALGLDRKLSALARHSARRLAALGDKADPQKAGEELLAELEEGSLSFYDARVRYFKTHNAYHVLASPELNLENINRLGVGIAWSLGKSRAGEMWIALVFAGR
jgi:uncharacterized protein YkwD